MSIAVIVIFLSFKSRNPTGKDKELFQAHKATDKIVIPNFPVESKTDSFIFVVTGGLFTVIDWYSAFFIVPLDQDNPYLLAFSLQGQQYTWAFVLQDLLTHLLTFHKFFTRAFTTLHILLILLLFNMWITFGHIV